MMNMNQSGATQQKEKIKQAQRGFMTLLEVLNQKFAGELKKESEK